MSTYKVWLFFGVQYSGVLILARSPNEALHIALENHERAIEASTWDRGQNYVAKR